jgi:hypothetical protein
VYSTPGSGSGSGDVDMERINGIENARPIATSHCDLTRNPIHRDHGIRRKGHTKLLGVGGGAAGLRRLGERKGESRSDCSLYHSLVHAGSTYRTGPGPRFAPVRIGQGRAPILASSVLLMRSEGGMDDVGHAETSYISSKVCVLISTCALCSHQGTNPVLVASPCT